MSSRFSIYVYRNSSEHLESYAKKAIGYLSQISDLVLVIISSDLLVEPETLKTDFGSNVKFLFCKKNDNVLSAYRDGLCEIGFDKIALSEEVLFLDSSVYGPVISLEPVLEKLRLYDFGGITKKLVKGIDSLDTYFLVFHKKLLNSKTFFQFWQTPAIDQQDDIDLLNYFSSNGFSAGVYITSDDINFSNIMADGAVSSLQNGNPFVNKSIFTDSAVKKEMMYLTYGQIPSQLLNSLEPQWRDVILDDLIHNYPQSVWLNTCCHSLVLDSEKESSSRENYKEVALIVFVWFPENVKLISSHIRHMPTGSAVYIVSAKSDILSAYRQELSNCSKIKIEYRIQPNRGRNESAYFVTCKDVYENHEYVCLLHDKKITQLIPYSLGANFFEHQLESLLASPSYIKNIISSFEESKKLGLIQPVVPLIGRWMSNNALNPKKDVRNFQNVDKLRQDLGVKLAVDPEMPYPMGGSFWVRSASLSTIYRKKWTYEDFPNEPLPVDGTLLHALERSYPLLIQDAGYYTSECMTRDYARNYVLTAFSYIKEFYQGNVITRNQSIISAIGTRELLYYTSKRVILSALKKAKSFKTRLSKLLINRNRTDNELIEHSKYFDKEYYRETYLRTSSIDSVEHYLTEGWKLNFNPSKAFIADEYYKKRPDVLERKIPPLLHYEKYGKFEGVELPPLSVQYSEKKVHKGLYNFFSKIYKNLKDVKILVVLHLFYPNAWKEIASYLSYLDFWDYKLIVTYPEDQDMGQTLAEIKKFKPDVLLKGYPNKGFDVGPFIDVLNDVNLDDFDVVYKLHSKGIKRPRIFIYGQYFRWKDWFNNLYRGLFGPYRVFKTINDLVNEKGMCGLVAARNLIVKDPKHKQSFVSDWGKKYGLVVKPNYDFVAGTCFAIKAELLKPVKELRLDINSFEQTRRGVFSLAHAVERFFTIFVENNGYKSKGLLTLHRLYPLHLIAFRLTDSSRLLNNRNFTLDYDFFYRVLEGKRLLWYSIKSVKVGDIRRYKQDTREVLPLEQCEPYLYLLGHKKQYELYCSSNLEKTGFRMSEARFDELKASMEQGVDEKHMIVVNPDNYLYDGQHRACFLLYKFGPDYEVKVLKIWLLNKSSITRGLRFLLRKVF